MLDKIRRGLGILPVVGPGAAKPPKTRRTRGVPAPPTAPRVYYQGQPAVLTDEAARVLGIVERHVIDLVQADKLQGEMVYERHPRYKNQRGGPSKYWVISLKDLERVAASGGVKGRVKKAPPLPATNGTLSYVSTMTAGVRLGVSRNQVSKWALQGILNGIRGPKPERGGHKPWLIERVSLDALIAKRKAEAEKLSNVKAAYTGGENDPPHPTRPVDSIEKITEDFLTFLAETSARVQRLKK